MCAWIIRPTAGVIESYSVPTICIDRIIALSAADGLMTFYCGSLKEARPDYPSEEVLEVIIKVPAARLSPILKQAGSGLKFLARGASIVPLRHPPDGRKPHLVR